MKYKNKKQKTKRETKQSCRAAENKFDKSKQANQYNATRV
jgi:hypothetical protein